MIEENQVNKPSQPVQKSKIAEREEAILKYWQENKVFEKTLEKKGKEFMPQEERVEIIKGLRCVDEVVLTNHPENPEDMSVCESLREIKPAIFANGGDRKEDNTPEHQVCSELGIKMIFNVGGGKIQSSSWLISRSK